MALRKFNRSYILKVETNDGDHIVISYPLTINFNVARNNLAATNTATFSIFNLNETSRAKIYKDVWDVKNLKAIQFFAGYIDSETDALPRVFNGTVKRAFSQRQGPNFTTEIEAFDGQISLPDKEVSLTLPAGATDKQALDAAGASLKTGANTMTIGESYKNGMQRARAMMGNPMEILNQISGGGAFIDNGNVYVLDETEVLPGEIRLINKDNGLLGTPKKSEIMVEVDMLFEPRLRPSQLIELQSETERRFDGLYKVTGIVHTGTISGSMGGDCRTSLTLLRQKDYKVVFDQSTFEYMAVRE